MMASAVNVPIHRSPAVLPTFPTGRCGDASGLYRLLPTLTMRLNRLGIVGAKEKPMKKIDCFYCHGTCGCHKKDNKSMISCTCPFSENITGIIIRENLRVNMIKEIIKWDRTTTQKQANILVRKLLALLIL